MPTFGRTDSGKWHIVGPDGCRYGRSFADGDSTPDETVTATDIVSYSPPDIEIEGEPNRIGAALGRDPRSGTLLQELALPDAIRMSDSGLCHSCRSRLRTHQRRRSQFVSDLKRATPARDVDWDRVEFKSPRVCYWCRAREPELWESDPLDGRVCPACGRLYNSPLGEPEPEDVPDSDRRPETPAGPVTPVVFGVSLPEYDPTELVGSNRPLIRARKRAKYAGVEFDLERVGHAFTPDALDAARSVKRAYADRVAADDGHRADVAVEVGPTARSVTIEGVYPDDVADVIDDCWEVASDPDYWFRTGWSREGGTHGHAVERSIPGEESVVERFPRLRSRTPAESVDVKALRQATDPGRYQRGERYYDRGAVTEIDRADDRLWATVQGSRAYDVRARLDDGRFIEGRCSCPDDAVPCKHVVAAVLASGDIAAVEENRDLEAVLAEASREELERALLAAAAGDLQLRRRLYEELQT